MNSEMPEDDARIDEADLIKKLETELGPPSSFHDNTPSLKLRPVPPAHPDVTVGLDPRPALVARRQTRTTFKLVIAILVAVIILSGATVIYSHT